MAEKNIDLVTVEVDYVCDKCGLGTMRPTGVVLLSSPPKYPHKCGNCGDTRTFDVIYPTVRHERRPA